MQQFIPGSVHINKIELHSNDGNRSQSLIGMVSSFDVYESITSPAITATVQIYDSIDLLRKFPIIGEEHVLLEWMTSFRDNPISLKLFVKSIEGIVYDENMKFKEYTLTLVSEEILLDASKRIHIKYETDIGDAVRKLFSEVLGSTKNLEIESTKGIDKVLLSNTSPMRGIDKLRQRAISKKYISSSYVFYENNKGYYFETIENIFDRERKVSDKIFFFDAAIPTSIDFSSYRNILNYQQLRSSDVIERISGGGLSNQVSSLDLTTGKYTILNYTNNIGQDKFRSVDDTSIGVNTTQFEREHGKTTQKTMFMTIASDRGENFIPSKISVLQAFVKKLIQNIIEIQIFGDSDLAAGNVIECNITDSIGLTEGSSIDRLMSGKYLVSKLRHSIFMGDVPYYTQSLELIKGGFMEDA